MPQAQLLSRLTGLLASGLAALLWVHAAAADTKSAIDSDNGLHVPSPDWRDQIIYFAMIDRFDDGDPANNDQGQGEFRPEDSRRYSGGDLAGLTRRLDYIRELGATALWITPPVAHRWWNQSHQYGGYHGYWATDFKAVDAHFGTLDDYRALSRDLHGRGMYLIQDIVVNHVADFFKYEDWRAGQPEHGYRGNPDGAGVSAPSQWPFSLNDPRQKAHRVADVYHWTPQIADFNDPLQERNFQLADLDDLNTESPLVRRALRDSYGFWIREAGVDAFRVDTAFYVPPEYFADFVHAKDPKAPGIAHVAAQTGRNDFLLFGEGFGIDRPFDDTQMRKIDAYMRGDSGTPLLPSMINFPLYGSLQDAFARGRPTAELADRIERVQQVHADPHRMVNFIDNHDVDRFLAASSESGLRQALLAMMTLPGIPTLYYGTEQGFRMPRASMFPAGYGAQGRDHFNSGHPLYQTIKAQAALRHAEPALRRGTPRILASEASGPGLLAWTMELADERLLVLFNTADHALLVDQLDLATPAGALELAYSLLGDSPRPQLANARRLSIQMPARAAYVWRLEPAASIAATNAAPKLRIDCPHHADDGVMLEIGGSSALDGALQLVVDGDLDQALPLQIDAQGRWRARVDRSAWLQAGAEHRLVLWHADSGAVSARCLLAAAPVWITRLHAVDPALDDHGPNGLYRYPTDATWQGHHALDLRNVVLRTYGTALQLDVQLADLVASWNPSMGFDHLALTIYLEIPGQSGGTNVMPLQHATLPEGMRWQRRLRVGGWSNVLTSAEEASAEHEGSVQPIGAEIEVFRERGVLRISLAPAALGHPQSLDGLHVYLTTWDYDAGYRRLEAEPGGHVFGGGSPGQPRIMDASSVLELAP